MKNLLFIIFFFLQPYLRAQTGFIYIVPSSFLDKDNLVLELKTNKELFNNENIVSLFSNDKTPLIGLNIDDFKRNLIVLKELKPSAPITFFEVDTLNSLFQKYDIQNEVFVLHFYSDYYTSKNSLIPNLVQRFLLCNDLMDKNGPGKNIRIIFHLKSDKNQNVSQIKKYFKDFNYEVYFF
jgi:hypothetical protein